MAELDRIVAGLRASRGFAHKRDIAAVMGHLAGTPAAHGGTANGDDCAVLPDPSGAGHLLFAIEGLVRDFVEAMPWFAGYSAVMVNLSDIAAMGGRAVAVVDALWSDGEAMAVELLAGMRAAAERYGVPLVGGHSNLRADSAQLAVSVLGRATKLIQSFTARPGDVLLMAVDLRGAWHDPYPFWDASTSAPAERLRADMELLPRLAEDGLVDAGKDISMAGLPGTLLMLIECSRVGAVVELDRIPRPQDLPEGDAALLRWLAAFPSFGYLLSVRPAHAGEVAARFLDAGIACAAIGEITEGSRLVLRDGAAQATLWDHAEEPFITAGACHA
ncbi:sll0787 family AIR synthase-like protein [Xylophilus rhododendri]|uniref:Sll0787 family AIR synthase-like protein n=1 Tax=Xylophilus rhododendri TaxID=2697032 RepID=A0A857JDB7_9BURK|nr:sll0787 family AIR synthase-like protein [Xylophilus rhododendri]QHJ00953.1 sll0787 family AIR synthase-like protein [Xylophilus rhododendri]